MSQLLVIQNALSNNNSLLKAINLDKKGIIMLIYMGVASMLNIFGISQLQRHNNHNQYCTCAKQQKKKKSRKRKRR